MPGDYQLVQLANGTSTLFSASYGEKMHPGLGPEAEADLLYVRQLKIRERLRQSGGEFVIWDVGLGSGANAIAALRTTRDVPGKLRIISFDNTVEPLEFALKNSVALGYVADYEEVLASLLRNRSATFNNGALEVHWEFIAGDFPAWLANFGSAKSGEPAGAAHRDDSNSMAAAPHAIFYDAFSPAKNPAMWTLSLFENLFRALDQDRPCALTTYSRSTMIRATLLLAGFSVGVGHATGMKEETTIAANSLDLIAEPLEARWLARAGRSDSAEPLHEPVYSRARLSRECLERLKASPQFQSLAPG